MAVSLGTVHPFTVTPRVVELIWGGTRLRDLLDRDLPVDRPVGETWEVHDDDRVESGPHAGRTLAEAVEADPEALLGRRSLDGSSGATRGFPLLVKFIDANAMLSVQVHPDDDYARRHANAPRGKAEAYYVVEARPGAKLYYGLRGDLDASAIAAAIADGTIAQHMTAIDVRAGDVVYTPPGTLHAFGGGLVFYEIQQSSTITYRLHDWGRVGPDGQPRELHLDHGLASLRRPQPPARCCCPLAAPDDEGERIILAAGPHFALEALDRPGATHLSGETFHLLTSLGGRSRLTGPTVGTIEIGHGRTVVVPACVDGYRYEPPLDGRILRGYVPDLRVDVIDPLRRLGHSDTAISGLGDIGLAG